MVKTSCKSGSHRIVKLPIHLRGCKDKRWEETPGLFPIKTDMAFGFLHLSDTILKQLECPCSIELLKLKDVQALQQLREEGRNGSISVEGGKSR